jgi:trehalose 6-phosphate synthase
VRLIVCSNSAPRLQDESVLVPRTPGGLVPLLVALLEEEGGDWVCTVPPGETALTDHPVRLSGHLTLRPVRISEEVQEQHYLTIGVRLMLWLFHYLLDTSREPLFDAEFEEAWEGYEAVNRAYADRLSTMDDQADVQLLINDYHLFLVPEMLSHGPRRAGRMTYFHGLPWCEPQYYAVMPPPIRDRILESLLACDVVGFHDSRWADAFMRCCARFLPSCQVGDREVTYRGKSSRIAVTPFPLDVDTLTRMTKDPRTVDWRKRLDALSQGRRIVARADRLDLWKNHLRGFAAYRTLLESDPTLARRWWFCAVTTVPTRTTERSREYQSRCEAMVAEINDTFGTREYPAVSLVYPDLAASRHCVTAALSQADIVLVNPTIDGMNLVAKEALFLAEERPVLLSVNAGAYEQVAAHVTPLQPFDVPATATAIHKAMRAAQESRADTATRREDLIALLAGTGPAGWLKELTRS